MTATVKQPPPSSSRRPRRTGSARRPAHVLLNATVAVGTHPRNRTSAAALTRNGATIQASFVFKRPPQASTLLVSCSSDLNPDAGPPTIVCLVDELLLLCVNDGRGRMQTFAKDFDYFVYRAGAGRPSLELLPSPHPFDYIGNVALLPRSDGHFTVAALRADNETHLYGQYHLHVFDSQTSSWSSSTVPVEKPWPVKVPGGPPLRHFTTNVITIGGKSGTVAWVDLWSGMLLCDLLGPVRSIRAVPLAVPLEDGFDPELGDPRDIRGISYIRDKGVLKFLRMEVTDTLHPDKDEEITRKRIRFGVDDWALTTWTGKMMGNSLKDWHREHSVQPSKITVDDPALSRVLEDSGLLRKPQDNEGKAEQRDLHNLCMYQPIPCSSGEDVVYLMAKDKFRDPRTWMLAVDMKNGGKLRGVAFLGNEAHIFSPMYYPSRISKYIFPKKSTNLATT